MVWLPLGASRGSDSPFQWADYQPVDDGADQGDYYDHAEDYAEQAPAVEAFDLRFWLFHRRAL